MTGLLTLKSRLCDGILLSLFKYVCFGILRTVRKYRFKSISSRLLNIFVNMYTYILLDLESIARERAP